MELTPDGGADPEASPGGAVEADGALTEPEPTPRPRHQARAVIASLTVIAVVAALVGAVTIASGNRDHGVPRLVLVPGGRSPEKAALPSDLLAGPGLVPYRYRLVVPAPDLGADAAVARLVAPTLDDSAVAAMAAALGIHGAVRHGSDGASRSVTEGSATLNVMPTPGGWQVTFSPFSGGISAPGSVPGSGGSGSSTGSAGSTGSNLPGDAVSPPDSAAPPPPTVVPTPTVVVPPPISVPPPTQPPAPAHLPDTAGAERIARDLLAHMGVSGDWSVTVAPILSGDAVACSPEPCAVPLIDMVARARTVTLAPRFEGVAVDGLSWQVQVGDEGKIQFVNGTLTDVHTLGRAPLHSVNSVFADLVAGRGIDPYPIPVAAIAPGVAEPFHVIAPVDVAIDHVTLGYAVIPATDGGDAVVDLVPTYVFSGTASGGGQVSRSLVAVEATVATPNPTTPPTKPGVPPTGPIGTIPPGVEPIPQPFPVSPGTGTVTTKP